MGVPASARRGTEKGYVQVDAHGVIACVARANDCNLSGAYPRTCCAPQSHRALRVYLPSGASHFFLYEEREEREVQRLETDLAGSGRRISRTPTGGTEGGTRGNGVAPRWANRTASRSSRPARLHAREAGNNGHARGGAIHYPLSLGREKPSSPTPGVLPGLTPLRLHPRSHRPATPSLFGAHNRAAFGTENHRGGGGPKRGRGMFAAPLHPQFARQHPMSQGGQEP